VIASGFFIYTFLHQSILMVIHPYTACFA